MLKCLGGETVYKNPDAEIKLGSSEFQADIREDSTETQAAIIRTHDSSTTLVKSCFFVDDEDFT